MVHSFAAVYAEVTIEDVYHALAVLYIFEILVEIAELRFIPEDRAFL